MTGRGIITGEDRMAKLLIVDDEREIAEVMQVRLSNEGYETHVCFHGGEALDLIENGDFDLIIMDYFMPGLKGDMVCQSLREKEKTKNTPILIMTAFDHYDPKFFTQNGATDVLFKPIDKDKLLAKIKQLLPSA